MPSRVHFACATRPGSSPSFATNGTSPARRSCVSSSSPGLGPSPARAPGRRTPRSRTRGSAAPARPRRERPGAKRRRSSGSPRRRPGRGFAKTGTSPSAVAIGTSRCARARPRRRASRRARQAPVPAGDGEDLAEEVALVEHAVIAVPAFARTRAGHGPGRARLPDAPARSVQATGPRGPPCARKRQRHVSRDEPVDPVGRNLFWARTSVGTPQPHRRSTVTSGTPGWSRNERNAGTTVGFFTASAIEETKSSAVALPLVELRYRRIPFRRPPRRPSPRTSR